MPVPVLAECRCCWKYQKAIEAVGLHGDAAELDRHLCTISQANDDFGAWRIIGDRALCPKFHIRTVRHVDSQAVPWQPDPVLSSEAGALIEKLVGIEFVAAALLRKCAQKVRFEVLWHVTACELVVKECQRRCL